MGACVERAELAPRAVVARGFIGEIKGGGRPFTRQDRSRFLNALDAALQAIRRTGR